MKHFRKSGGFTLVELVVSIAVASLVTMAATTVLMLALRVNRQTADTATQQYTVRALLTTMEKAATTGKIQKVTSKLGSWQMLKEDEITPVFEYNAFDEQILSNGVVVMENVYASNAILENGLLSISLETREGIFETTVYCRGANMAEDRVEPTIPSEPTSALETFLSKLLGELNSSGVIKTGNHAGKYYSQWYIGDANFGGTWNAETPWCACFVSWALAETLGDNSPRFADVEAFRNSFSALAETPKPGDLVFFNFDDDAQADHIGVVYDQSVDEAGEPIIITIEGNSAGRVAVRSYPLTDPRILGYATVIEP